MMLSLKFSKFEFLKVGFSKFAAAWVGVSVLGFALSACAQDAPAAAPEQHGIAVANMDRSVKPGNDFYEYANGDWLKRTEIPPDRGGLGVFSKLADLSNKRTAGLIEEIAKSNPAAGSGARKVADLYNSYMDEATIE